MPKTARNPASRRPMSSRKAPAARPALANPRQPRALKTRKKLLEALERLLKKTDFEKIAVTDIAKAAGVSVGSVYAHFKDKDAFLSALIDLWRGRVRDRLSEALAADLVSEFKSYGGLRPALHAIIADGYEQVVGDAHIIRAIQHRIRRGDAAEWEAWRKMGAQGFDTIALLIDVYKDEVRRRDKETAKRVFNFVLNACLAERCIYPNRGAYGVAAFSKKKVVDELTLLSYAYLTAPE